MHKEFNSTCITLVAFFDPKHFLVENRAPESIYFLTPNTQYGDLGTGEQVHAVQSIFEIYERDYCPRASNPRLLDIWGETLPIEQSRST